MFILRKQIFTIIADTHTDGPHNRVNTVFVKCVGLNESCFAFAGRFEYLDTLICGERV